MRLCISSVFTTSVLVTAIILLMYPLMKSRMFIRSAGTNWIMLLLICVLFRMFLPVEFFYTYTFRFTEFLTTIRKILIYDLVPGDEINLCIYHIFIAAWIIGIVLNIWKKCRDYSEIRKEVTVYGTEPTDEVREILKRLESEYTELQKIKLLYSPFIGSPMLMGIRSPQIVLPEKEFSERELRYILAHEVMHIRSHDTFWKLLIDILCTIYWWNPAFYLLKNEAFNIIEIKNDLRLTKEMSQTEKEEYLDCLFNVAKLSAVPNYIGVVAFSNKPGKELQRRFRLVISGVSNNKIVKFGVYVLIAGITFASSCVIFEPKFELPEEDVIGITDSNTYIIEENGVYKVYMDGEYLFSTDNAEYLPFN